MKGLLAWVGVVALGGWWFSPLASIPYFAPQPPLPAAEPAHELVVGDEATSRQERAPLPVQPLRGRPPPPGEDIRLRSPGDGVQLAGTLTRPAGARPHPAVLLVSGAGPHDRDGTVAGHRPFRVLAERLTSAGFAVLRLDDRGVGDSRGSSEQATIDMRVSDALGALSWLTMSPYVDAERIGIVGHSEGATVAAMVGAQRPLNFIVSLAGPGLPGHQLSPQQVSSVLHATGAYPETTVTALVAAQQRIVDTIAAKADQATITRAVHAGLVILNALQPSTHRSTDAQLAERAVRDGRVVSSPWFRSFVETDPRLAWRRVHCPILALAGSLDVQVPPGPNMRELAAALVDNPDVEFREIPGLNHLLQPASTGLVSEYANIKPAIDERVLRIVVQFASEQASRAPVDQPRPR